jgi:hypothetical protein
MSPTGDIFVDGTLRENIPLHAFCLSKASFL